MHLVIPTPMPAYAFPLYYIFLLCLSFLQPSQEILRACIDEGLARQTVRRELWDDAEGWYGEGGGRGGSGWGTCVCLWWVHVDVWQNQYKIVK